MSLSHGNSISLHIIKKFLILSFFMNKIEQATKMLTYNHSLQLFFINKGIHIVIHNKEYY